MLYCDTRLGGQERWTVADHERLMRVPEDIPRCVVFILGSGDGGATFRFLGTGFFVGVPSEADPNRRYVYVVTARHILLKAEERIQDVYVSVNRVGGKVQLVRINKQWTYPDDSAVDLAVVPLALPLEQFDYKHIQSSMWATESVISEHNIGVGDDLIISGLFVNRSGRERNIPIVRQGILAAMDDEELIDANTGLGYRAYLAEVRSIGGLSGSPVFAFLGPARVSNNSINLGFRVFLLGIVRGHWDLEAPSLDPGAPIDVINMGIAMVTPAHLLFDLLHREDFVKERRAGDKELLKKMAPVLDSTEDEDQVEFTKDAFESALKAVSRKLTPSKSDEGKK